MRFRATDINAIPGFTSRRTALGVATVVLALAVACTSASPTAEPTATSLPTSTPTTGPPLTARSVRQPTDSNPAPASVDVFAVLEEILADLGPRESATEEELAAARYLESRFRELGYATELQAFSSEDLSLGGLALTLNTSERREFAALPMSNTGLGEVSGVLTPVGLAIPEDIPEAGLEGRIALAQRGVIRFQVKAENVFAAGAVGLVVYNSAPGLFEGMLATQPEFPVISISGDDGEAIEALLMESETDSEIVASITLTSEDRLSRNVIAVKKGPGDAVVVLGGHYDTVPGISGANDNASGTAVLLAIAESLAEVDLPFTLRIVPFGSEELGLLGSRHYVQSLSEEELRMTKFMFNFDALGTGRGVSIFGNRELTGLASAIGDEISVKVNVTRGVSSGASDFATFQAAGVPFMMMFGDDFSRIHTEFDTIEFVQPEVLDGATAVTVVLLQSEEFAELMAE